MANQQTATDRRTPDDVSHKSPFGVTKPSIGQRENERNIESLRRNVEKILNGYGISMEQAMPFLATLGDIEVIALNTIAGNDYLDKVTAYCRNELLKTIQGPNGPAAQKEKSYHDHEKPRMVGTGANRHVDTGAIKMPQRTGDKEQQMFADDKPAEKPPTTVLGNPISDELPAAEVPAEVKAAMEQIHTAATTPDLSDVTKLKEAAKVNFDADELGSDDKVIPAEVIEDKPVSALDETFGPKQDGPLFDYDAAMTVANMLGKAFPERTSDYKLHFFREVTGLNLVKDATTAEMQADMFAKLQAAIDDAIAHPIENTPKEAEFSAAEISGPYAPENQNSPIAPKIHPSNAETTAPTTNALAVVSKNEVSAPSQSAIGFRMPSPEQFQYMQQLAKFVAQSGFYKDVNNEAKAMVIFMKGYALNIEPMTALDGIFVINGRPYIGAKLVKGLLEATGQCQRFDIFGDEHQCTVTIQRKGRPQPNVYKFTMEDAKAAKLMGSGMYEKWPAQMLRWRAIKQAVDTDFPELGFGLGRDDEDESAAA